MKKITQEAFEAIEVIKKSKNPVISEIIKLSPKEAIQLSPGEWKPKHSIKTVLWYYGKKYNRTFKTKRMEDGGYAIYRKN